MMYTTPVWRQKLKMFHLGGMDAELKLAYQYRTYRSKSVIDPWSAAGDSVLVYALDGTADRHQLMANMDVRLHRNWRGETLLYVC